MTQPGKPHSSAQFGAQRDFWWNADFLELVRERIAFPEAHSLLDVGCGRCHWTAIAAGFFPGLRRITGVDIEDAWVAGAAVAMAVQLDRRDCEITFRQADAHDLPFPDASFDVVTCQTVLMHLTDPLCTVREMLRVVNPGGLLLIAEPRNSPNFLTPDSAASALSLDELTARYRFWTAVHMGRKQLGMGDADLGDKLPALLRMAGAEDIQSIQNDRVNFSAPPYDSPAERAMLEFEQEWERHLQSPQGRAEFSRLALAGGLTEGEIRAGFTIEAQLSTLRGQQRMDQTYSTGGGHSHYLTWARRPR